MACRKTLKPLKLVDNSNYTKEIVVVCLLVVLDFVFFVVVFFVVDVFVFISFVRVVFDSVRTPPFLADLICEQPLTNYKADTFADKGGLDQPPARSRIRLGKLNTSSSSNPNYLYFETNSIPRSDMAKCNAANKIC